MAKWSVALFGHDKPNFSMIEIENDTLVSTFHEAPEYRDALPVAGFSGWLDGVVEFPDHVYHLYEWTGNIHRARPGYIIGYKPCPAYWSPTERKGFLIVTIDGPTRFQMDALCEQEFDLDSYREYNPMSIEEWVFVVFNKNLTKINAEQLNIALETNKEQWYSEYLLGKQEASGLPMGHWRKRRFRVFENELESLGVDLGQMKDNTHLYNPDIVVPLTKCYDRLKERNISIEDKLSVIEPRTLEEIQNPKTAETILAEIRT